MSDATDIQTRAVAQLAGLRPLRLADATDSSLYALGAEAGEFNSVDYPNTTQVWAAQLFNRPELVDGIYYRSRYLNGRVAVAIFERGGDNVAILAASIRPLAKHPQYSRALRELNVNLMP